MYSATIIQRLLGLVLTYFLVRALSETQYAEYNLVITYISLMASFGLPGLNEAVMQSTARKNLGVYFQAQKIKFLASVISALILLIIAYFHKFEGSHSQALYVALSLTAFFFPLYSGLIIWKSHRNGQEKFKQLSLINTITAIATNLVIIILLIIEFSTSYLPLLFIYLLIPSLLNASMFLKDFYTNNVAQQKNTETGMIKYGLKVSIYSAIHSIALRIDALILFYFISPQVMATFMVANKIPEMFREFTQTLLAILAPRFAKEKTMSSKLNKAINIYAVILGVAVIAFTFTLYPYFMNLLFSDKYGDAIFYSQMLMCSLIIGNVANINFRFIRSHKDEKSYKTVMLIISTAKIISAIILVPLYGIWGAIYSIFIYRIAMMIIVKYLIHKNYRSTESAL